MQEERARNTATALRAEIAGLSRALEADVGGAQETEAARDELLLQKDLLLRERDMQVRPDCVSTAQGCLHEL